MARYLASRGESSTRKRRRSCGERKGGDDWGPTAKPGNRSWRAPKYRGRELVIEGRSLGLRRSCCLHGRAAEAVSAISNGRRMRVRVHRYAGKRQRDQRHGPGARGVASKHRRGSNRPTTRNLRKARRSDSGVVKHSFPRSSDGAKAQSTRSRAHETRLRVVEESSSKSRFGRILRRDRRSAARFSGVSRPSLKDAPFRWCERQPREGEEVRGARKFASKERALGVSGDRRKHVATEHDGRRFGPRSVVPSPGSREVGQRTRSSASRASERARAASAATRRLEPVFWVVPASRRGASEDGVITGLLQP